MAIPSGGRFRFRLNILNYLFNIYRGDPVYAVVVLRETPQTELRLGQVEGLVVVVFSGDGE